MDTFVHEKWASQSLYGVLVWCPCMVSLYGVLVGCPVRLPLYAVPVHYPSIPSMQGRRKVGAGGDLAPHIWQIS